MQQALQFYLEQRKKILAQQYAGFLISWDHETQATEQSVIANADQMGVLSAYSYELMTDARFESAVETLYAHKDELEPVLAHEIEVTYKNIQETKKIPADEYVAYSQLMSEAYPIYVRAKRDNDFELFRPYLEKIVDYVRKQTVWLATDKAQGYDVLLDMYEPNYNQAKYDAFFNLLREKLVPVVKKVTENPAPIPAWANQIWAKSKQVEFCEYLRDVLCFDKSRGIMAESAHPFTTGFGTDDVRITNFYHEDILISSIFSVIHETGHALYEQQGDKALNGTFCSGGASLGMHESQSRFYENLIGRSLEFWQVHFAKLQQIFAPQLDGVTVEEFVAYVNRAERSFVRTEADELTYPLHVMLRYEIEKLLITGQLQVKDLPQVWKEKFAEYFGITPPTDVLGVLQDMHWAGGSFGYFPTYALGSAIASQLYYHMNKDFDVAQSLASGNTKQVNDWLKDHIHKYGSSMYPDQILRLAIGEDFDAKYYVDYLVNKYSK